MLVPPRPSPSFARTRKVLAHDARRPGQTEVHHPRHNIVRPVSLPSASFAGSTRQGPGDPIIVLTLPTLCHYIPLFDARIKCSHRIWIQDCMWTNGSLMHSITLWRLGYIAHRVAVHHVTQQPSVAFTLGDWRHTSRVDRQQIQRTILASLQECTGKPRKWRGKYGHIVGYKIDDEQEDAAYRSKYFTPPPPLSASSHMVPEDASHKTPR